MLAALNKKRVEGHPKTYSEHVEWLEPIIWMLFWGGLVMLAVAGYMFYSDKKQSAAPSE